MSYTVKNRFKDVEDNKIYEAGDKYSASLSDERKKLLTTRENKYREIFLVEDKKTKSKTKSKK